MKNFGLKKIHKCTDECKYKWICEKKMELN